MALQPDYQTTISPIYPKASQQLIQWLTIYRAVFIYHSVLFVGKKE